MCARSGSESSNRTRVRAFAAGMHAWARRAGGGIKALGISGAQNPARHLSWKLFLVRYIFNFFLRFIAQASAPLALLPPFHTECTHVGQVFMGSNQP